MYINIYVDNVIIYVDNIKFVHLNCQVPIEFLRK